LGNNAANEEIFFGSRRCNIRYYRQEALIHFPHTNTFSIDLPQGFKEQRTGNAPSSIILA
jgi:hypothetical protein